MILKQGSRREARDKLTFDRVRFLGTALRSNCKSGGSGMPKEKPPYLKENMYLSKQRALTAAEKSDGMAVCLFFPFNQSKYTTAYEQYSGLYFSSKTLCNLVKRSAIIKVYCYIQLGS